MKLSKTIVFTFICLLSSFSLSSCMSSDVREDTASIVEPKPIRETGCATLKGSDWQKCIEEQFVIWEKRENAPVTIFVLYKKRESILSQNVKYTYQVCMSDFCRVWSETRVEEAWYQKGIKQLSIFAVGVAIGIIL